MATQIIWLGSGTFKISSMLCVLVSHYLFCGKLSCQRVPASWGKFASFEIRCHDSDTLSHTEKIFLSLGEWQNCNLGIRLLSFVTNCQTYCFHAAETCWLLQNIWMYIVLRPKNSFKLQSMTHRFYYFAPRDSDPRASPNLWLFYG